MHGYLDLFKIFVWSTLNMYVLWKCLSLLYFCCRTWSQADQEQHYCCCIWQRIFTYCFFHASAYNYSHFQVRCLHSCFPTPNIKKASFILALWAPKSLGTANPTHIRAKAFAKSQLNFQAHEGVSDFKTCMEYLTLLVRSFNFCFLNKTA